MPRWALLRHVAAAGLFALALCAPLLPRSAHAGVTATPQAVRRATCSLAAPRTAAGYAASMHALPLGGDATLSVRLASGDVAWIFADTLIAGVGMPHSTVVMQHGGCFSATRRQLLPNDRNGTYWWPTAATGLPGGSVLLTATDGYAGHVRAALLTERGGVLSFASWLRYWPATGAAGPSWFAGLLVDRSTLWVYGTRITGARYVFGKQLWLASVPLNGLVSGRGWVLGRHPIMGASPHGVDTAVAPYRDARGYHLITLSDGVLSNGPLVRLDGPTPAGPFTVRPLLTYNRAGQWRYNAAVHPEARLPDGKLLVTINNNWPWGDVAHHPLASYQPSYFEVAAD
jgi:hypothetical protein